MKYKLFSNSPTGMHCVQACLQMLLCSFDMPVLSLEQLDQITCHDPEKFTWMGDALLWLKTQGLHVENYENLDYRRFIDDGEDYLKTIWDTETFQTQAKYSDFKHEQMTAAKMLDTGVKLVNRRLTVAEIAQRFDDGYFVMLSINPFALESIDSYGSHLVVIGGFDGSSVTILDPDKPNPIKVAYQRLEYVISESKKSDFNAIFVKKKA